MTNAFVPHKPEPIIVVEITKKEAVMIQEIRKVPFGKIVIHKMNGIVNRIEPQLSTLITGDEEVTLPIVR